MTRIIPAFFMTPFGLTISPQVTQALLADVRRWNVVLQQAQLPVPINNNQLTVSLYRILLEAGIAFTQGVGFQWPHMSALAPLFRYIDLFGGTAPSLHVIGGLRNADSRFKQLIGEEIAVGIAWYVLLTHMNVVSIADVGPLLMPRPGIPPSVVFVHNPPDNKRPDYYCIDAAHEIVFAESKGTIGPSGPLIRQNGQMQTGWHQVSNVNSVNGAVRHNCGRVVIGTNIQFHVPRIHADSTTFIRDPVRPGKEDMSEENDYPLRVAYAKVLRYAGDDAAAELLLGRKTWVVPERLPYLTWNGLRFIPIGVAPIGGRITIAADMFDVLRDSKEDFQSRVRKQQQAFQSRAGSFENNPGVIVRPDGVVVFAGDEFEGDDWWPDLPRGILSPLISWGRYIAQ